MIEIQSTCINLLFIDCFFFEGMDLDLAGTYDDFLVFRPIKQPASDSDKKLCKLVHQHLPHPENKSFTEDLQKITFMTMTRELVESKHESHAPQAMNSLEILIHGLVDLQQKEILKNEELEQHPNIACEGKIMILIEVDKSVSDTNKNHRYFDVQLTHYKFQKTWHRKFCRLKPSIVCTYHCMDFQILIDNNTLSGVNGLEKLGT